MKRAWVFILLGLLACKYDLSHVPAVAKDGGPRNGGAMKGDAGRRDAASEDGRADGGDVTHVDGGDADAGGDGGAGGAGGKGGSSGKGGSGGHDAGGSKPTAVCDTDETRCHGSVVEMCSADNDAWEKVTDCKARGCNPVSFECNACDAPIDDDGVLTCVSARAEPSGDAVAMVDTSDATDTQTGSCGGGGSPELSVEWTAPATDYWVLDTHGSDYDTVLYARDCACDGSEIACNNNASTSTPDSELVSHFELGQRVALVVDGNAGDKGKAVINAHRVTCPTLDLKLKNLPASFVDKGADGTEAYRFTPDKTAFYSVRVHGDNGTRVCMQDGPRCGGPEIACNTSGSMYGAQVIRELHAGSPITLVVTLPDGSSAFDLDITEVVGAVCADSDPLAASYQVTSSSGNYVTGSCAAAGVWGFYSNADFPYNEVRIPKNYPADSNCKIRIVGNFPAVAYLLRKDCGGGEAACVTSTYDSGTMQYTSLLSVPFLNEAQDYVIVVEYTDDSQSRDGSFGVNFECIA